MGLKRRKKSQLMRTERKKRLSMLRSLLKMESQRKRLKKSPKKKRLLKLRNLLRRHLMPLKFLRNKILKSQSQRSQTKKIPKSRRPMTPLKRPKLKSKKRENPAKSQKVKILSKKPLIKTSLLIRISQPWHPSLLSRLRSKRKRRTKKKETNSFFLKDFSNSSRLMKSLTLSSQVTSASWSPF